MTLEEYIKMKTIETHINNIICETFKSLSDVYPKAGEKSHRANGKSRIIFPPYGDEKRDKELRFSEQELRFTFVEKFTEYCDNNKLNHLYSVETPTNDAYLFSEGEIVREIREEGENIKLPCIHNRGISANIDMVVHDENKHRICLIEFKANNPTPDEIEKDLVKLTNREEWDKVVKKPIPRYFIGMVKSSQPDETRESILGKIYDIRKKTKDERNSETVHIVFYNIDKDEMLFTEEFKFE